VFDKEHSAEKKLHMIQKRKGKKPSAAV